MPISLKLLSAEFTKKACSRALAVRKFSVENRPKLDGSEQKVRRIHRLGLAGLAAILASSYYLTRNSNQGDVELEEIEKRKTIGDLVSCNSHPVQKTLDPTSTAKPQEEESLREKHNFINKVVNRCANAVFYLEIRDPHKKDLETGEPLVTSNGSGFLISDDGWALTNAHVVLNKPHSTIRAVMRDGRSFKVQVEDADMSVDLALLKLDAEEKLPSLQFAASDDTSIGEWVVALGSPLSLSNSVTVGIVSCVDRPAEELGLKNYSMTYIQTDASITFGNSGGPLVNLDGHVIGVNNLRLTSGISFAIPVAYAKKFLENGKHRIKTNTSIGPTGKTLFGITTISVSADILGDMLREHNNIPDDVLQGLLVWKVIVGTPASDCGIQVGDIITHINGLPVTEPSDLYNMSPDSRKMIEIKTIHEGKEKTVYVVPRGS